MSERNEIVLNNEWQGKINVLSDKIRLEISEAKLAIDRENPNIPFALRRLEDILDLVKNLATTKDRWNI